MKLLWTTILFKRVSIVLLVVLGFEIVPNKGQNLTVVHDKCKARIGKPKVISLSEAAGNKAIYESDNESRTLMRGLSVAGCNWYKEYEDCESTLSVLAEVFSNSTNKFARYLSNIFSCLSATSKDSCIEKGRCRWDILSEACTFDFYTTGYENSPCVKAAPALAQEYSTNIACQKHKTAVACNKGNNCAWLEEEKFCIADTFPIYFGLKSFAKFVDDSSETFESKNDAAVEDFIFRYITSGTPSNWNVVLKWEVPKSACPERSTVTECNYVEAFLENYLPTSFYCLFTYDYAFNCAADPLCVYDYDEASCSASDEVGNIAILNAISTLVDKVKAEVDRDVLTATISCPTITIKSDCRVHCQWDVQDERCTSNLTFVRSRIAEAGSTTWRGRSDPVCKWFAFVVDTNCTSVDSFQQRETTTHRAWKMSRSGDLWNEKYMQLAIERANDASVTSLWSGCPDCSARQTCLEAEA